MGLLRRNKEPSIPQGVPSVDLQQPKLGADRLWIVERA